MMFYTENSKEPTRNKTKQKPLGLGTLEFSKVLGHTFNIQRTIVFLHTTVSTWKMKFKHNITYNYYKNMKYLGINLSSLDRTCMLKITAY